MTQTIEQPPKLVYDIDGQIIEVIVTYQDYKKYLRTLADNADWETLPRYLQDAIDLLLIEEAKSENGQPKPLEQVLADIER